MSLTIIKALKKTPSIKNLIHKALAGWEKARDDGKVHASDLMKELEFCPREVVLRKMAGVKPKDQFVGTSLRITFQHGKDMENRLRNFWLRERMVGYWRCMVCERKFPKFGKVPKVKCPHCAWVRWRYDEVSFHSPYSGVSGSLDSLIDVDESKHRILEVKSIDKDEFKNLKAPLAEHKARTSLYMRLAEESHLDESERVNTKQAHVLYVSKSFGFKDESLKAAGITDAPFSPFKEYVIERDDTLTESVVQRAVLVKRVTDNPALGMPCGVCVNGLTSRAQKCSVVKQCWGGMHPNQITWIEKGEPRHQGKLVLSNETGVLK